MIRMLDDRILVEPLRNPDINPEGAVYTGEATTTFVPTPGKAKQVCMGRVVSVGPGKRHPKTGRRCPPEVQEGAYITFSDTCHRPVKDENGTEFLALREGDIMTISDTPYSQCFVVYRNRGPSIPAY